MADVAFGSVGKIVDVALKIKEAAETVKQNSKECRDIQRCVTRVTWLIKRLDEVTETLMGDEVIREALQDLAESLEGALELVTRCQRTNVVGRFFGAAGMAKELRRVQDDILRKVSIGTFATSVLQVSITLTLTFGQAAPPPQPRKQGIAGMENLAHGDVPSGHARCEKDEAATGSGVAFDSSFGLTKFSLSELEAATDNFSKENIVGEGYFGVVFKGVLCNGLVVAIKEFHEGIPKNDIVHDISIGVKLQHKNVVKTLGYCVDYEEVSVYPNGIGMKVLKCRRGLVVTGYLPNGNLANTITQGTTQGICWSSCFQIIQGIAQGIHYLHEQNILHLDLKPENILFDSDMNPVIVDLGLSRGLQRYLDILLIDKFIDGTMGYMPPEYIYNGTMSKKFDVFSFGIILLQIITSISTKASHCGPCEWDEIVYKGGQERLKELFDPMLIDESQLKDIERCLRIGLLCAEYSMEDRPTMAEVLKMLNGKKRLPIQMSKLWIRWKQMVHNLVSLN